MCRHPFLTLAYKIVATILIPVVLLSATGCYSYKAVDTEKLDSDDPILVQTSDGESYWLLMWRVDGEGTLTGRGARFQSHQHAIDWDGPTPFDGSIGAEEITSMTFLTKDGKRTTVIMAGIFGPLVGLFLYSILADR